MDDKELNFRNYDEVEKEKKGFSELPTFFISAMFITIALLFLPVFTKFHGMDKTSSSYSVLQFFSIFGIILIIAMGVVEIILPLRLYIRFAKRRGDFNGIVMTVIGVCGFTVFICAFMLFFGFLLVF